MLILFFYEAQSELISLNFVLCVFLDSDLHYVLFTELLNQD